MDSSLQESITKAVEQVVSEKIGLVLQEIKLLRESIEVHEESKLHTLSNLVDRVSSLEERIGEVLNSQQQQLGRPVGGHQQGRPSITASSPAGNYGSSPHDLAKKRAEDAREMALERKRIEDDRKLQLQQQQALEVTRRAEDQQRRAAIEASQQEEARRLKSIADQAREKAREEENRRVAAERQRLLEEHRAQEAERQRLEAIETERKKQEQKKRLEEERLAEEARISAKKEHEEKMQAKLNALFSGSASIASSTSSVKREPLFKGPELGGATSRSSLFGDEGPVTTEKKSNLPSSKQKIASIGKSSLFGSGSDISSALGSGTRSSIFESSDNSNTIKPPLSKEVSPSGTSGSSVPSAAVDTAVIATTSSVVENEISETATELDSAEVKLQDEEIMVEVSL